ncbi:MAG: hypothetical protein K6A37_04290 [Saccharofermentans sp.]|nr:hypothetical protein [Saccharofermentans sp.]
MDNELMKILLAIAAVSIFAFIESLINVKRYRRSRLILMIPISLYLMVAAYLSSSTQLEKIALLCDRVEYLNNADYLIFNLAVMLEYMVLKLTLCPMVTYLSRKREFQELYAVGLYTFDDDLEERFLQERYINFRVYFKAVIWGMAIAAGLCLGITWIYGSDTNFWFFAMPCAALIIILQAFHYVNGKTKEECLHDISGNDVVSSRVSDYYKMREVYERLIPEPLLSSNSGSDFSGHKTATDLLELLKESDDFDESVTADYFFAKDRYKEADLDSVKATLSMMKGKNVLFFDPFYCDLEMYITLPMVKSLTAGKNCLVLCGRKSLEEDVSGWLTELMRTFSHMNLLWRVGNLSDRDADCEIGILNFANIYNKDTLDTNREFLKNTGFVLMIEPSIMINTSQIAVSILSSEMENDGKHPVYCICDRNADGLVDTMSHLLRSEIVDVVAMPVPRCDYTSISWDADGDFSRHRLFDRQTRYFGNGIELSAIAVKNQVPGVTWYSESKAPVRDIKWIAGQNYASLCKYMNLPSQQEALYDKIRFVSNLWSSPQQKEAFIVADDEFCNMFSMMRLFLSRGKRQSFVNVLSENYILRDYMRCNSQMFISNPNAIPSLIPDYAKTDRNTLCRLLILMSIRPVLESEAVEQFHLAGIDTDNVFNTIQILLKKYFSVPDNIITCSGTRMQYSNSAFSTSCTFKIEPEDFEVYFAKTLKNAYFILEDEKNEKNYIDAKLFSHVTQLVLPGQYVCYDGKYYVVKYISPEQGVVLRRASDQFDSRKYYKQIRSYTFEEYTPESVISQYTVTDIEFTEIKMNFGCKTTGYVELNDNHDLRQARVVDLTDDPNVEHYSRSYKNKSVLRIKLPDMDSSLRFTICLMLNEIFKTVYPHGWQYVTAITDRPEDIEGVLNYVVYPVEGTLEEGYIYIVEDSEIDLGLLDSVEKNFGKLMEIIADFLDWHFEKMKEPISKDPLPARVAEIDKKKLKKRSLVVKMLDRLRKILGPKNNDEIEADPVVTDNDDGDKESRPQNENVVDNKVPVGIPGEEPELDEDKPADIASVDNQVELPEEDKDKDTEEDTSDSSSIADKHPEDRFDPEGDPNLVDVDGTDIFEEEEAVAPNADLELQFEINGIGYSKISTRYQKSCYIKYGYESIDGRIKAEGLRNYLRVRGWCNNNLTMARHSDLFAKSQLDLASTNVCDFCCLPLSGISFERLSDGRTRCNDCSASAVQTLEEFKSLFGNCVIMMQDVFSIKFRTPIKVEMTDAKTINKGVGRVFKPSTSYAARTLGYARKKGKCFYLFVENGCPKLAGISTVVHEMTHIWQFVNWDLEEIRAIYGMNKSACTDKAIDILMEGMAMWAEIQYLYIIGEHYYATQQEAAAKARRDVYGIGFRLFCEQYPIVKDSSILKFSPFSSYPPLEPDEVRNAVRSSCTEKICSC